ncbi:MAG TPA: rhamnulokinase family protein [Verrucomicrobiae bacterium]|nr:rhamnulokinase family protein [Verrucomicrobiae bacterium]
MSAKKICLAVDLGAGSGRVVAGIFDGARLELAELNRFSNEPIKLADGWHWNFEKLFGDIKTGIALAVKKYGDAVVSVGVDTWGVDYGLLDANGQLLAAPFQYRDARTNGMMDLAFEKMPRAEIYQRTGIQFMFFNTLFQLLAEKKLSRAEWLLFMPDLIHYFLTGIAANEKSIASTSQLLNPKTQNWDDEILRAMSFPRQIFGKLIDAGTVIGELLPEIANETGAKNLRVIAPAGHDTASAVVGVPAEESEPVFLSSGTWSLIGRELNSPLISDESFAASFSNEGGVLGTTRFLKNISGMWLLQECKRAWDIAGKSVSYDELQNLAKNSPPFAAFIDPDAPEFSAPQNMPEAVTEFCRRTGQIAPTNFDAFARTIFESLALKYRFVKNSLAQVTGKPIDKIYIVGGGSQNDLLNQFAADAMNCIVVAGPVEATSIGNVIMQLHALGEISSLTEGRALTRRSFAAKIFEPKNSGAWNDAFARFQKILLN